MVIIKTNSTTSISQPSRSFEDGVVNLKYEYEGERKWFEDTVSATYELGRIIFDYDFEGVEANYYYVIVSQENKEIVKFKMYCTDQDDLQSYSINEGNFVTAPQSDNDFIVVK